MIVRTHLSTRNRRGMILMVVLALLTLFTIVGITFVYISDSFATSARLAREGENYTIPDMDPELAASFVLGQLIYDVNDDAIGVQSALRGWSLARNMYGWNSSGNVLNDKAYAGVGRLRNIPGPIIPLQTWDMVNYQFYSTDKFVLDPEQLNPRIPNADGSLPAKDPSTYIAGNVPYTYPDQNNMFLAHLDPVSNTIVIPSFSRPWLAEGKYTSFRPQQVSPAFPTKEDAFGDVKNYDGGPGGNDSVWIDPGGPVLTAPNGLKYKMLVAPLILPLDGRINVNTAGNILLNTTGATPGHASNQGFGPYEVNLMQVMTKDSPTLNPLPIEWINLFLGNNPQVNPNSPAGNSRISGKYGISGRPQLSTGATAPTGGTAARGWAMVDMNGVDEPSMGILFPPTSPGWSPFIRTNQYSIPSQTINAFNPFPSFPGDSYNNGYPMEFTLTGQAPGAGNPIIHPMQFNPIRPGPGNRIFSAADMAALLRQGGTGSDYLGSDLLRLCPINLSDPKTRNLLTTLSFDLDRPAPVPYVWDRNAAPYPYVVTYNVPTTPASPPTVAQATPVTNPFTNVTANRTITPGTGEFDPATWRSLLSMLNQINVNRHLTPYPTPQASGMIAQGDIPTFTLAQNDRVALAQELFNMLQLVTGARNPVTDPQLLKANYTTAGQWDGLRYLAQIAVNLVDYIDADDIITPFTWNQDPALPLDNIVYGVEIPRLVINEVYVQVNNDPSDPVATNKKATKAYNFNVYAELLNPLDASKDLSYKSGTTIDPEAWLATGADPNIPKQAPYSVYQLLICQGGITATMQNPANALGDPNYGNAMGNPSMIYQTVGQAVTDWCTTNPNNLPVKVLPINGAFNNPNPPAMPGKTTMETGFYVIGPPSTNTSYLTGDNPNFPNLDQTTANMMYTQPLNNTQLAKPTVLLQRLLCPGLPPNAPNISNPVYNPNLPYNPYITVDYLENTCPTANVNDMRQYTDAGANGNYPVPAMNATAASTYSAMQRAQPYAAASNQWNSLISAKFPLPNPSITSPQNTFYSHNSSISQANLGSPPSGPPLKLPFDWLVHLDRQLISKTELIYASTCKPHELTQLFVQNNLANSQNKDSSGQNVWLNQQTLLYRLLEMITTTPQLTGISAGGRQAGRVNINLVNNLEILNAICDPPLPGNTGPNYYAALDVQNLFNGMVKGRQSTFNPATGIVPPPSAADTPYWGYGPGLSPALTNNTNVGANPPPGGPLGFVYPAIANPGTNPNPYQQFEMLNKLTNNITTRSNVFGVWMTFGFFEVVDSTTTPPTLGAEIGKIENRHKRHRAFAIVDRTNLTIKVSRQGTPSQLVTIQTQADIIVSTTDPNSGKTITIPYSKTMDDTFLQCSDGSPLNNPAGPLTFINPQSGLPWKIQPGSVLTFDPNTNSEETVVVNPDLTVTFYLNHSKGCTVVNRGNPGPCSLIPYNPRNDPGVVVYFAVIN